MTKIVRGIVFSTTAAVISAATGLLAICRIFLHPRPVKIQLRIARSYLTLDEITYNPSHSWRSILAWTPYDPLHVLVSYQDSIYHPRFYLRCFGPLHGQRRMLRAIRSMRTANQMRRKLLSLGITGTEYPDGKVIYEESI